MLIPVAKTNANDIGTSIFVRLCCNAPHADLKNGRPENKIAGMAIKADIKCKNSRVAPPIVSWFVIHNPKDNNMMLPAANPATPIHISKNLFS